MIISQNYTAFVNTHETHLVFIINSIKLFVHAPWITSTLSFDELCRNMSALFSFYRARLSYFVTWQSITPHHITYLIWIRRIYTLIIIINLCYYIELLGLVEFKSIIINCLSDQHSKFINDSLRTWTWSDISVIISFLSSLHFFCTHSSRARPIFIITS